MKNKEAPASPAIPNQSLAENPGLYLVLRQDIISNARFLYGGETEFDLLTAYSNETATGLFNVYDAKRDADIFEVSLVAYTIVHLSQAQGDEKRGKLVLESSGNSQLEAMHLLATAIQEMVHKAKKVVPIAVGDTFAGVNCVED